MIVNLIASILLGFCVLTIIGGFAEIIYNVKQSKPTSNNIWIVPAIFAAAFWFVSNLK
jgi:hypothetical protein